MFQALIELIKTSPIINSPKLFLAGLGLIDFTGLILLLAVAFKFVEHAISPQKLKKAEKHPFSTIQMTACVVLLFYFWLQNIGQIQMDKVMQYIYFTIGSIMVIFATIWHILAKFNISVFWSDGIEIKEKHSLVSTGAYALARHPMYASLLMWCWGASLIMFNWATLILISALFLPLIIQRAKDEERELLNVIPEYLIYQQNVRMLTPKISGSWALFVKITAAVLFGYCIWVGITLPSMILLLFIHIYLGYSLTPEKTAFAYRSKSGMMLIFWGLSLLWHPFYCMLYVILAMFIYGLKWNCPCMIVHSKFGRCPCFDLINKYVLRRKFF